MILRGERCSCLLPSRFPVFESVDPPVFSDLRVNTNCRGWRGGGKGWW